METITEIQNIVAVRHGYEDWRDAMYSISLIADQRILVDEAMQEYARQRCNEQIKACSENVFTATCRNLMDGTLTIAILNTPNVVTTK